MVVLKVIYPEIVFKFKVKFGIGNWERSVWRGGRLLENVGAFGHPCPGWVYSGCLSVLAICITLICICLTVCFWHIPISTLFYEKHCRQSVLCSSWQMLFPVYRLDEDLFTLVCAFCSATLVYHKIEHKRMRTITANIVYRLTSFKWTEGKCANIRFAICLCTNAA